MKIVKALGDAFRKGADLQVYGPGGSTRSTRMQRLLQPGSRFDYASEAGQLYDNGVVLPAINWKAGAVGEAELVIQEFDQTAGKWIRSVKGPDSTNVARALSAFERPNDYYDLQAMLNGVQLSWDVRGNAYLFKRRDNIGRIIGFYWIPHTQIRPLADTDNPGGTKLVTRYEYIPLNGSLQYLAPEDVIHIRYGIDPKDPASGLSPLAAELRDICADNEVSNWLAALLRNGGTPGAILSPKATDTDPPTPEQRSTLESLWNSFVGDKRGQALAMPLAVDVVNPSWSPEQLELAPLRDMGMVRIMAALGLDPMVLGFSAEKQTFANKDQAIDDAGKRTILPTIGRWAKAFSQSTLRDFQLDPAKYRFWWDTSTVSWLVDDVDALHTRVRADFQSNIIDLYTAEGLLGMEQDEKHKGVYAWMLTSSPAPVAGAKGKEEAKHLDRVRRTIAHMKEAGL